MNKAAVESGTLPGDEARDFIRYAIGQIADFVRSLRALPPHSR
jgi:hypothetical protein